MVRPGDLFVIDINGVSFQGYRTCFFRTYCVGDKPTEFQKEVYQCAYDAVTSMSSSIRAGITNKEAAESWMEKGRKPGVEVPTEVA
ncbi:M24 family metallopeptidase [Chloroflexota bacterium]